VQTSLHRPAQIDSPLLQFRKNVTSQCGEDGIIAHIANTLQVANKFCVEFGAWDGVHYSNCFNLLTNNAWRGIMIEANAEKYGELVKTYRDRMNVTTVNRFVDFEGPNSLDHILTERQAPRDFGLRWSTTRRKSSSSSSIRPFPTMWSSSRRSRSWSIRAARCWP